MFFNKFSRYFSLILPIICFLVLSIIMSIEMAFAKRAVALLVMLMAFCGVCFGVEYIVGDSAGWTQNFDYQAWASTKTVRINDALGMFLLPSFFFFNTWYVFCVHTQAFHFPSLMFYDDARSLYRSCQNFHLIWL